MGDKWLCAVEPPLWLERFMPPAGLEPSTARFACSPALNHLNRAPFSLLEKIVLRTGRKTE